MDGALAKLKEEQKKLKKKFTKEGKKAIKEALAAFFKKHPSVHSIFWAQYTPHYQDGDPCYFSVNSDAGVLYKQHPDPENEGKFLEIGDDPSELDLNFDDLMYDSEIADKKLAKDLSDLMDDLSDEDVEDIMEVAFGDGVMVFATHDGRFISTEYEHD